MKFEISSSNGIKSAEIFDLSRNLSIGAELYSVDGDNRELIGFFTHKIIVYFASEFAAYAMQNYVPKSKRGHDGIIKMVKDWIEDPNTISPNDMLKYTYALNAVNSSAYTILNNANTNSLAVSTADYAAMSAPSKQDELERQGRFILDFFKSGKVLFLI